MAENEFIGFVDLNELAEIANSLKSEITVDRNDGLNEIIEELKKWNPYSFYDLDYLTIRRCFINNYLDGLAGIIMKFVQDVIDEKRQNNFLREDIRRVLDEKEKINKDYREALAENKKLRLEVSGSGNNIKFAQDVIDWRDKFEKLNTEYEKVLAENERMRLEDNESAEMKSLYESGWSLRKIAEKFNCDKNKVKRRLKKMGVQIRKRGGDYTAPVENK